MGLCPAPGVGNKGFNPWALGRRDPLAFETSLKVRFRDIDAMGHVNNAVIFTYMEQARTEYFLRLTGARDVGGLGFIVAHAEADYESPAFLDETIVVRVWPTRVGDTSFALDYELRDRASGRLVARGRTVQVHYDYGRQEKAPIRGALRELLEAELAKGRG